MQYKNNKDGYRKSNHDYTFRHRQPFSEENLRNPKEISAEAKWLMRKEKFKKARDLLETAHQQYPNNKYFYSMLIKVYGALGDINNARKLFDEVVRKGIADVVIYNSMIDAYGKNGRLDEARKLFDEVVRKGIADVVTYTSMIDAYYHKGKFAEIEELISGAPEKIKNDEELILSRLEVMRKQKKYSEVLRQIESLLNNRTFKEYNSIVLARVIRAYCLKDSGRKDKAIEELRRLKTKVSRTNIHYPRIICGLVFCYDVHGNESEQFKHDLEMRSRENISPSLSYDIECALRILKRNSNRNL